MIYQLTLASSVKNFHNFSNHAFEVAQFTRSRDVPNEVVQMTIQDEGVGFPHSSFNYKQLVSSVDAAAVLDDRAKAEYMLFEAFKATQIITAELTSHRQFQPS